MGELAGEALPVGRTVEVRVLTALDRFGKVLQIESMMNDTSGSDQKLKKFGTFTPCFWNGLLRPNLMAKSEATTKSLKSSGCEKWFGSMLGGSPGFLDLRLMVPRLLGCRRHVTMPNPCLNAILL